jgi:hypothetical protein
MRPWRRGNNSGRRPSSALRTKFTGSGRLVGAFQLACEVRWHASRMLLPMARRSDRDRSWTGTLAGAAPVEPSHFLVVIETSCHARRSVCFASIHSQFPTQSGASGASERRGYSAPLVPLNRHHRSLLGNLRDETEGLELAGQHGWAMDQRTSALPGRPKETLTARLQAALASRVPPTWGCFGLRDPRAC